MAHPPSFDTLIFRLSDPPFESTVTCSLTVENTTERADPDDDEQGYHVAFTVGSEDPALDERRTLEWIQAHLASCSVDPVEPAETQRLGTESLEKMRATIRKLADLWAKAHDENAGSSDPGTPCSSTTTLNEPSNDTDGRPRLGHRDSYTSELSGKGPNAERFHLAFRPHTPSGDEKDSRRGTLFDEKLVDRLSAVEWYQGDLKKADDLITPLSPLLLPPHRPRDPSSPLTPDFESAPTPIVEQLAVISEKLTEEKVEIPERPSRWYHFWHTHARINNMKPTIAVLADKSIVVLPSPPTDKEKYLYAVTWRLPLYIFGTFSFLAVSVGMWFFVIASKYYWWLGAFVVIIEAYLLISYFIGFCGRDFDLEGHKKIVEEHAIKDDEECPSVDVYLPCCKEPIEILENTYRYVSKIDYPNLKVWVLDDGDMESVRRLAAAYGFNYICRPNRGHLKKAGNLRHAFTQTNGEFFLIFDADFCPRADILKEMIPRVRHEPKIAIVQTPQFFRPCEEQTWSEQGASATQEFFYRIVQVNRDRFNAAICVGSNALYRRQALVDVGGTAEIGHSEDVHTGFYAVNRGWTLRYMPLALACGISPDTPAALFSQQMRWCAGSSYLLTNPEFWKSSLTWIQKICYMSGMMFYSSAAFMIIVSNLPGPLLVWLNPHLVLWYNCFFAVPSLIYATIIFRLWSRVNYNFNVNYVFTLQQYAYTMAIKDRIFGTTAGWVPSGDNNAHVTATPEQRKKKPHTKYRNMRIVCFIWVWGTGATMFAGVAYRIWEGWYWWHFLPIMLFDAFQLFQSHKFIFYGQ